MRKLYRLLTAAVLALSGLMAVGNAQAAFPPSAPAGGCAVAPCYQWGVEGQWYNIFSQAVSASMALNNPPGEFYSYALKSSNEAASNYVAIRTIASTGESAGEVTIGLNRRGRDPDALSCPSDATLSGSVCTCTPPKVENSSHNGCESEVNICSPKAGQSTTVNWTVGFVRTEKMSDWDLVGPPNKLPEAGVVCSAGCKMNIGTPTNAWRSAEPTEQGLYRLSLDIAMQFTGEQCATGAGDAPVVPTTPDPVCPGFVGEVNGKAGCFGTKGSPVNTIKMPPPSAPTDYGNPAAGNKPSSGPGAGAGGGGRTPLVGKGGNAGGSSGASINPGGNGTTDKPGEGKEQANCGAPGQPKCSIDETGMPDGLGLTEDQLSVRGEIWASGKGRNFTDAYGDQDLELGRSTAWGIVPEWTLQGRCEPWELYVLPEFLGSYPVRIDMCPYKAFIDGAINFIWITLTIFGVIGMVRESLLSKGI